MNIETRITPAIDINSASKIDQLKVGLENLSEFADCVSTVDNILDELAHVAGDNTAKAFQRLRNSLEEFDPGVTFLGQVKSGKTALVSALVGWPDLLPSDVNPWTSVTTSLHVGPGLSHPKVAARFKFMTAEEWDRLTVKGGRLGELAERAGAEDELERLRAQIDQMRDKSRQRLGAKFEKLMGQTHEYDFFDKNLLERYICLGDDFFENGRVAPNLDQGQFADITRSADLYLNSPLIPFRMCLRDTPGVNDSFMMREQVTIRAIRDSKLCVVVLSASQALSSVDLALMRLISNLESREIIVFVNRIDELADPASQIPEIEASIRETLQRHCGSGSVDIVFGSAYWANKVLSDELDALGENSSRALLAWAEHVLEPDIDFQTAPEIVWSLSGVPALLQVITSRIVDTVGEKFLRNIAMSAVNIASAQQATNQIAISADEAVSAIDRSNIESEFEQIVIRNSTALEFELDNIVSNFQMRADRVHDGFVSKSSESFLKQFKQSGANSYWDFQPDTLRIQLRTAYKVMGKHVQSAARTRYEHAISEVASLLYAGFGRSVEGVQLGVPSPGDIPAPVCLAQTLALDFNDSWWSVWWHRVRGKKAFTGRFEELVSAETSELMFQLKVEQTNIIKADAEKALRLFFDQQREILHELLKRSTDTENLSDLFLTESDVKKRKVIEESLLVLQPLAA